MTTCSTCGHPNVFDFIYCQKCGSQKIPLEKTAPPPLVDTSYERVKRRIEFLERFHSEKPHQCQKSSLLKQLELFLWSLPDKKSLKTAMYPARHHQILNIEGQIWKDGGSFGQLSTITEGEW